MSGSWGALLVGSGPPNQLTTVGGVTTGPQVDCPGGIMVITAVATAWGGATATLNMLGPDGATLLPVSASQSTFTANGVGTVYLPPCVIQMAVSGGPPTAAFVSIARVVR
jgi:hypothetical protein